MKPTLFIQYDHDNNKFLLLIDPVDGVKLLQLMNSAIKKMSDEQKEAVITMCKYIAKIYDLKGNI